MEDYTPNASPQETPRRESPDSRAAHASHTIHQEAAAVPPAEDEQPTPPRLPRVPPKSDAPPLQAPAAPRRSTTRKLSEPAPEPSLGDLVWMPPAEDRVAQFLNDVADIPPPTRAREGAPAASFVLPGATSPEEAERKKARAEPFWSQMAATPMEPPAPTPPRTRSRRTWRKRGRLRLWLALSAASLILVVAALAVVVYTHPGLLHIK
jgi:hypothetical protein